MLVALAGPANRQGRIAADVIAGRDAHFRGVAGHGDRRPVRRRPRLDRRQREDASAAGRRRLREGLPLPELARRVLPRRHCRSPMKVIFRKSDGRLLGAQAVGRDGVDKRIDALAVAIQLGGTIYDLEECRALLRAPVRQRQVAGQLRRHGRRRRAGRRHARRPLGRPGRRASCWTCGTPRSLPSEAAAGRGQHPGRPAPRRGWTSCRATARSLVICRSGQRAYYATRILLQNGFNARVDRPAACSRTRSSRRCDAGVRRRQLVGDAVTGDLFLGLDVGSSSTKAVLVDADGGVVAEARRSTASRGRVRAGPSRTRSATGGAASSRCAAACSPGRAARVRAVGVSALGPCVLPADADGRPLRPAILYGIDSRAVGQAERLTAELGADAILARCGSRLSSQSAGPKLRWLADEEPQVWSATRRVFGASSYLASRLTGEYVLDHHSASHWAPLYDVHAERLDRRVGRGRRPGAGAAPAGLAARGVREREPGGRRRDRASPEGTPVAAGSHRLLGGGRGVGAAGPRGRACSSTAPACSSSRSTARRSPTPGSGAPSGSRRGRSTSPPGSPRAGRSRPGCAS